MHNKQTQMKNKDTEINTFQIITKQIKELNFMLKS
jgi:hypothetical protein